jgi:hypothetical protein
MGKTSTTGGGALKVIGTGFIIVFVLFICGIAVAAVGPQWVIDDVLQTGNRHYVTCHEKWHTDHVRKVPVTAIDAATLRHGDRCPG